MKKIERRTVIQEINVVTEIVCDCCGRNIDINRDEDFLEINKSWSFYSKHDNNTMVADICEECCDKISGFFVHKPSVIDYMDYVNDVGLLGEENTNIVSCVV